MKKTFALFIAFALCAVRGWTETVYEYNYNADVEIQGEVMPDVLAEGVEIGTSASLTNYWGPKDQHESYEAIEDFIRENDDAEVSGIQDWVTGFDLPAKQAEMMRSNYSDRISATGLGYLDKWGKRAAHVGGGDSFFDRAHEIKSYFASAPKRYELTLNVDIPSLDGGGIALGYEFWTNLKISIPIAWRGIIDGLRNVFKLLTTIYVIAACVERTRGVLAGEKELKQLVFDWV